MSTRTTATVVMIMSLALVCACGGGSSGVGAGGIYDIVVAGGYGGGLIVFKDVLNRPSAIVGGDVVIDASVAQLNGRMHVDNDWLAAADNDSDGIYLWSGVSTLTNNQAPTVKVGSDWYYSVQLVNGDLYAVNGDELHIWRDVAMAGPGDPPTEVWVPPSNSTYFAWVHLGRLYVANQNSPYTIHIFNDASTVTGASVPDVNLPTVDWARRLYWDGDVMFQPLMSNGLISAWSNISTVADGTGADRFIFSRLDEYISMAFGGGRAYCAEMFTSDNKPVMSSFDLATDAVTPGPDNETIYLDMVYQLSYQQGVLFGTTGESIGGIFWYRDARNSVLGDPDGFAIDPRMGNAKQMYVSKR